MTGMGLLSQEVLGMTATGQNPEESLSSPSITLEATESDEAIKYANQEWCPIENRLYGQKSTPTPSLTHVFNFEMIASQKHRKRITTSLEYFWGMQKLTLDLDVPRNRFFLRPSLRGLYYEYKWTLIPQLSVIEQCFNYPPWEWDLCFLDRIPALEDPTYEYTFCVIDISQDSKMKQLTIARLHHAEDDPNSAEKTEYTYPFKSLTELTLVSHINPRCAIMHAGRCISFLDSETRRTLYHQYPALRRCFILWLFWQKPLRKLNVYKPHFNPGMDSDNGDYESDVEEYPRDQDGDESEEIEFESDHEPGDVNIEYR